MKARIQKHGDDFVLVIPPEFVERLGLSAEVDVEVDARFGTMCVYPPGQKPFTVEDALAGITDENIHPETDWGPPVGKEVW